MRLIDFDRVSLSSLNRHATARRADVSAPKASVLAAAIRRAAHTRSCAAGGDHRATDALFSVQEFSPRC